MSTTGASGPGGDEAADPRDPIDLRAAVLALVVWVAAVLALRSPWWVPVVLVVTGLAWIVSRHRRGLVVLGAVAWVAAGAGVALSAGVRADALQDSVVHRLAVSAAVVRAELVVTSDPVVHEGRFERFVVYRARTVEVSGRGVRHPTRVPVLVLADTASRKLTLGTRVRLAGRLSPARTDDLAAVLSGRGPPEVVSGPNALLRAASGLRAGIRVAVAHHPVAPDERFACDLAFLGNRLPDREARVEEFFLRPAAGLPERQFLIGGNGWETKAMPANVRHRGHVYTAEHNAFNCTPKAVLNVARDSMASIGFSPATRVFEAAGAAACLITDAWEGIEQFLTPDREVLVARDGQDVAEHMAALTPERAKAIGEAALARVLAEHTYALRAVQVDALLRERVARRAAGSVAA